ncbi:MAG: tRNA (guanosine(18)-2'-O)-methyltransferase TrmH [Trueperaceae bacterium]|nr:tRNA (guanosine(18)-2'-O)-methyltransferase TrmH [Trueperaceae bacterium]
MPTARRAARVFEVLARRQPDLTVLAEDVYKPHNLSAMIRSCDAVGIGAVHAVRPTGGVPTYGATSASAEKWVDVVVHTAVDRAIDELKADGMQVLAAHFSAHAVDYRDVDYVRPTAILFGNERSGVSGRAAARADAHVVIPMLGMVESLNVSVATAVILFEAQRQRREAGRYLRPALPARVRNDAAFRWLYPARAEQLDAAFAPIPWLDADGDPWPADADGPPPWALEDEPWITDEPGETRHTDV